MALNWTATSIPAGGSFEDVLYNFLVPLEAPTSTERLQPALVKGNVTIGIGFDLKAGGLAVQNAVFKQLGLNRSVVELSAAPHSGTPEYVEYGYIQRLRANIASGSIAGLNAVMQERANNSDAQFVAFRPNRRGTFNFTNDEEVRAVFDVLWPEVYSTKITNKYPFLSPERDAAFQSSRERL